MPVISTVRREGLCFLEQPGLLDPGPLVRSTWECARVSCIAACAYKNYDCNMRLGSSGVVESAPAPVLGLSVLSLRCLIFMAILAWCVHAVWW